VAQRHDFTTTEGKLMRNVFKPALALSALALAAGAAWAPTASAAEKPIGTASTAVAGTDTQLTGTSFAWIHFLPTVTSDHLTAYQGDSITTLCYRYYGGQFWDVVVDRTVNNAGFVPESYLTVSSLTPCSTGGIGSGVGGPTWVHLHPEADWEHQVVNAGDSIQSLCSGTYHDPADGITRIWDVVVDNTNGLTGFTWDGSVSGATPPAC
jgi:hypothetical protein